MSDETIFAPCRKCKAETEHTHMHNTAHGLPGTHMVGSERYECDDCGTPIYKNDPEAKDLKFILD